MIAKRKSAKREAVYKILANTDKHPRAEDIFQQARQEIPDISRATVYRNLSEFVSEGRAQSVGNVQGHDRYDGNAKPHPHFICEACNAVIDLDESEALSLAIDSYQNSQAHRISSHSICFFGLCKDCEGKNSSSAI
ncbi:transcriptional repressor [Clostridiaceae bacterium OttesenSCG-928-D20]|nr:transcriptional repressor [Clostridiaceae bacterium OttesenSCG-928-D20]